MLFINPRSGVNNQRLCLLRSEDIYAKVLFENLRWYLFLFLFYSTKHNFRFPLEYSWKNISNIFSYFHALKNKIFTEIALSFKCDTPFNYNDVIGFCSRNHLYNIVINIKFWSILLSTDTKLSICNYLVLVLFIFSKAYSMDRYSTIVHGSMELALLCVTVIPNS